MSDKPLTEMTVTELEAKQAVLQSRHAELQKQIMDDMHEQARIENDLTIVAMLIAKAYRR